MLALLTSTLLHKQGDRMARAYMCRYMVRIFNALVDRLFEETFVLVRAWI